MKPPEVSVQNLVMGPSGAKAASMRAREVGSEALSENLHSRFIQGRASATGSGW
jgi:hypothetical protein